MKKLRIVLLILFFELILVGCQIHTHDFEAEVITATCTTKGYIKYTCDCGYSYKDKYVKALGHNYSDWIIVKEATKKEEGLKYRECSVCKEVLDTEVIPVNDHKKSDWIIDIESTCSTGLRHKECTICKEVLEIEENTKEHNYVNGKCSECGSIKDVLDFVNGYIYFGEYPQTLKEESVTVSSIPDNDGYYVGNDGERYAKVEAKPYDEDYLFNDKITTIVEGSTYYFKVEPIKWKIEEENNGVYKLISEVILDCQMYYSSTVNGHLGAYPNNYEYSDIRKWLNNVFYDKAFTKYLQTYINTTEVDEIYLPSVKEMTNTSYGYSLSFTDSLFKSSIDSDETREKQLTDYAKALGCYMITDSSYPEYYNNGTYWLRSPYDCRFVMNYESMAYHVNTDGSIDGRYVDRTNAGVAPALTITIK